MKGSVIWNLQRYSSLIVLSYVVYVMIFILSFEGEIGFFDWTKFFFIFSDEIFNINSMCFYSYSCFYWFVDSWN